LESLREQLDLKKWTGERVLIDYDPVLKRWNCGVCGWSWSWRASAHTSGEGQEALHTASLLSERSETLRGTDSANGA